MKVSDIKVMSDDEIETQLKALARKRLNLRFARVASELDDTSGMRKLRRDYARLLTIRHERRRSKEQA